MPIYLLDYAGEVVNKTAATNEQAAWNWANRWASKQYRLTGKTLSLRQHLGTITTNAHGSTTLDRDPG